MLSHARGIPGTVEALLFLVGAVGAYAIVGSLAFGGLSERLVLEPTRAFVWGGLHIFSVGVAIGGASLIAHLVTDTAAWPLAGFLATAIYMLASACELAVAHAARSGR